MVAAANSVGGPSTTFGMRAPLLKGFKEIA
jgi:hypothetical protein